MIKQIIESMPSRAPMSFIESEYSTKAEYLAWIKSSAPEAKIGLSITQRRSGHRARGGGPGGVIWPCGQSLSDWFTQCPDTQLVDVHHALRSNRVSSILELGCGTGIVGLALAGLGIPRVVLTDGDVASCELCTANAARSGLAATASVCQLEWGKGVESIAIALERIGDGGRCAQWIVGGDCLYHDSRNSLELEVTMRELLLRGGCSLVVLAWCERGQHAESFLWRLRDLGDPETVVRERDAKYAFLSKRKGRLSNEDVEFGISLLRVHEHVTVNDEHNTSPLGALRRLRQRLAIQWKRSLLAVSVCVGVS